MKLAKFSTIATQISQDERLTTLSLSAFIYRKFDGAWFDTSSQRITDEQLLKNLEDTLTRNEAWRHTKDTLTYFPLGDLNSACVATFSAPPRKATLSQFEKHLRQCVERGTNAFNAAHDALTGLMNKLAFETALVQELQPTAETATTTSAAVSPITARGAVATIFFDIDHFKQVNDSFGHLYGDIVLRCVALRAESVCGEIEKKAGGRLRARCGRLGGEEFGLLLSGSFSREEELEWAESLRAKIWGTPIPDDSEWSALNRDGITNGITLPHVADRRVTISLGIASHRGPLQGDETGQVSGTLRSRADIALYRAKAAGRDQSVVYGDILAKYGRVIEHNAEADVVCIDIGRQVGVSIGQEFAVYHPLFTGKQPFVFQDGRTQRRLGTYPKVQTARIVVFDVQTDIAFCRVVENTTKVPLQIGSVLEAVPIGSIAHLITAGAEIPEAVLTSGQALEAAVGEFARENECPTTCVIGFSNAVDVSESHGTAIVNKILAAIFMEMRSKLPSDTRIGQIGPTQFAAVASPGEATTTELASEIISSVQAKFGNLPKLNAGFFSDEYRTRFEESQKGQKLDVAGALEFAKYAATEASLSNYGFCYFDETTPTTVLRAKRAQDLDAVVREYENFKRLGAITAVHENQLALAYLDNRQFEKADEAIQRATAYTSGVDDWIWMNAALIKYVRSDYPTAVEYFHTAVENYGVGENNISQPPYVAAYALALYGNYKQNPASGDVDEIRRWLNKVLEPASRAKLRESTVMTASSALQSLTTDTS